MNAPPKILIVDDDHDTLDLLEIFLYRDYDLITALNGFEALTKLDAEKPALVMTDIKMPVMDGIRFLNNLRRHPTAQNIPVIAITSFTKEHTVKSLLSLGFKEIIAKPPEAAVVLDTVAKILKPAPAAAKGRKRAP